MRNLLAFLGIEDLVLVYAKGLALGDADKPGALAAAREEAASLTVGHRAAA